MTFTGAVEPYLDPIPQYSVSFGQFMITLGMMFNITALTLSVDDANEALKGLIEALQDVLLTTTSDYEKQEIANTIKQIENTDPLSGLGFFSITSMVDFYFGLNFV